MARGDSSRYLSPVRRIEGVAAPPEGRYVALAFEDGPTVASPRPEASRGQAGLGITEFILDVLGSYGGQATFCVVGSTAANYPDTAGAPGTWQWNGTAYDHFPEFGKDALAGVWSHPELVRRILAGKNELANHSWRHIITGPEAIGHRRRGHHAGFVTALDDFRELHERVLENFGCTMRLGRPPHGVDVVLPTPGGGRTGHDVYDVLEALCYDYLGQGVDGGGGGASSGSYDNDVERMVLGLQRGLEKNGKALSGAIVSLKDGYDFAGRSPVVSALPRVMQLFRNYGYKVVTVSSLLEMSPFADVGSGHPVFQAARERLGSGWWVAYRDNTVRPGAPVVRGELAAWAMGGARREFAEAEEPAVYADIPAGHPYRWHVETATTRGFWDGVKNPSGRPADPRAKGSRVFGLWDPVSPGEFAEVLGRAGLKVGEPPAGPDLSPGPGLPPGSLTHGQALIMLREALSGGERAAGVDG